MSKTLRRRSTDKGRRTKGRRTKRKVTKRKVTNKIGPKSTAEIFINIKALPQIAASVVSKNQSFDSI